MSWDDDDFVPNPIGAGKAQFVQKFDDEIDAKGSEKESWDEEEAPKQEEVVDTGNKQTRFPQIGTNKHRGRQLLSAEEAKKEKEYQALSSVPLTPAQKKEAEAAEKAADFQISEELFGGCDNLEEPGEAGKVDADNDALFGSNEEDPANKKQGDHVDTFVPQNQDQFKTFAKLLADKITPHKDSYFYTEFLKNLLKDVAEDMEPEEIKELSAALNVITNRKIKNAQGKKGKKGKKAVVIKEIVDEDMVEDNYDSYI